MRAERFFPSSSRRPSAFKYSISTVQYVRNPDADSGCGLSSSSVTATVECKHRHRDLSTLQPGLLVPFSQARELPGRRRACAYSLYPFAPRPSLCGKRPGQQTACCHRGDDELVNCEAREDRERRCAEDAKAGWHYIACLISGRNGNEQKGVEYRVRTYSVHPGIDERWGSRRTMFEREYERGRSDARAPTSDAVRPPRGLRDCRKRRSGRGGRRRREEGGMNCVHQRAVT